jgi:alpha-L-rhamnosidase
MLGDGFYRSTSYHVGAFGEPCLLCQLEVTYDDGTQERICTDETWLTRPSAITLTGVYDGEVYDARLETPHWADAGCDESSWHPVQKAVAPVGQLTAHTSPADRITEVLQPIKVEKQDGVIVVTFDKEIAGWVRLKDILGTEGQKVKVEYISESPLGIEEYYCKGSRDGETYAPRFTWYVFSQVKIHGLNSLTAQQIQAEAVNTDVPLSSEFYCSHPLLNKINSIWQRSQLDNMHGCIASDCPHRERLPYTGDGQIAAAMVMLNFDAAAFYQKWLRDMRDAQNPVSGYVPNGAPWQPTCGGGVAWGAAMNVIPWEYYLQYGDLQQLRLCYQPMCGQVRHMLTWLTPEGTMFQQKLNYESGESCYWLNLGDWVPPYGMPSDEIVHTFYLWLCSTNTANAAKVLGDEAGYREFHGIAQRTWEAFHRKFYDAEKCSYGDFGPNILALYM